jgi:hypothetical protein
MEDEEDTELGKLSEDNEPGWVMGAISRTVRHCMESISNTSSFPQKHPAVPDSHDGSDGTSYPLTEYNMFAVSHLTDGVAYCPPVNCTRNAVTYTHHQNDTCFILFAGGGVML